MINDDVLVNVFVPVINESFDILIPLENQLSEVTKLISHAVKNLSTDAFDENGLILCDRTSGQIFDSNMRVYELGILNGSELILI